MSKQVVKKKHKDDCGFRKHLKCCKFKPEYCRPPTDKDDYGECCHLYNIDWNLKSLKEHGKRLTTDMLKLENSLKHLKKTDPEKYNQTKKVIRDMFNGLCLIGRAITFIKRSGGGFTAKEKRVAEKLKEKLKSKGDKNK